LTLYFDVIAGSLWGPAILLLCSAGLESSLLACIFKPKCLVKIDTGEDCVFIKVYSDINPKEVGLMSMLRMNLVLLALVGLVLGGCTASLNADDQAKLDAALKAADAAAVSAQKAEAAANRADAAANKSEASAKRADAAAASAEASAAKAAKAFEMGLRK
jgi:hypothetical protein